MKTGKAICGKYRRFLYVTGSIGAVFAAAFLSGGCTYSVGMDRLKPIIIEKEEKEEEPAEEDLVRVRPVPALAETGKELTDFIPEGWALLDSVTLDFNEDGVTDYVGVLEYDGASEEEEEEQYYLSPRILFAVFGDSAGKYHLSFQDANLIRAGSEGGVFGDPYMPLTSEGTSFSTHSFGGSAWKWSENFTYTYIEDEWYLTEAEEDYGYGPYITDYSKDDYLKGTGIRKKRSDSFDDMDYNIEHTEEDLLPDQIPEDEEMPYDLIYEVPLDEPPTLYQAGMRWWLAVDRRADWTVKLIEIAEGIDLITGDVRLPGWSVYFEDCDEEQAVYTFSVNEKYYLAVYRYSEQKLYIIAEEPGFGAVGLYQGRIYYAADVNEPVSYWSTWEEEPQIVTEERTVGLKLYQADFDGSDKSEIFEYFLPIEEGEVSEEYVPYLSMIMEINGGQIVAEVYIGDEKHPFYRMDLDGKNKELIGTVPDKTVEEKEAAE